MIFGIPQNNAQNSDPNAAGQDGFIFDVDAESFETRVLQASMQKPVIVDFWAPWCGPCKQLMPVLEKVVSDAGGQVLMAKVDIDANPEIAQAFKVQSVPTVFVLFQGQPVTAFSGVKQQSELKMLVDQLVQMAQGQQDQEQDGQQDISALMDVAEKALNENDIQNAYLIYKQILAVDPQHVDAFCGLAKVMIAAGQIQEAEDFISGVPDKIAGEEQFQAVKKSLEIAKNAPQAAEIANLEQEVSKDPKNHAARFDLSEAYFAQGRHEEAAEALLEILKIDPQWEDEKARKKLLEYFEVLGFTHPVSLKGRRKLSSLLFS